MSQLFTRTLCQGMHDALVERGEMLPYPTDKIATEVFDRVAQSHRLPIMLERPLSKEASLALAQDLVGYGEALARNNVLPDETRMANVKTASQTDLGQRAFVFAQYYMQKAANEGSLVPSAPNTLADAATFDQIARVDQRNRPEGTYGVPQGTTDMPVPGVLGRELGAPGAPTTGAQVKAAGAGDFLLRQGNALVDGVRNIPGAVREGLRSVHELGQDFVSSPSAHARDIANAESWRLSADPAMAAAYEAKQNRARNMLLAQGAGGALAVGGGALGLGLGAKALYDRFTAPSDPGMVHTASEKTAEGILDSIKSRAANLYTGARGGLSSAADSVQGFGRQLITNQMPDYRAARDLIAEGGHSPEALAYLQSQRNKALGMMAAQGLGVAGTAAGLGAGLHHAYQRFQQPEAEDMQVTASDGDDALIDSIIKSLQDHGVEVTPEIVAAVHADMTGSGGEGGGDAGADPTKQANAAETAGPKARFDSTLLHGLGRANKVMEDHPRLTTGGKVIGGLAAAGTAAAIGKKVYDKVTYKDEEEKKAAWNALLKAAGEGSLVPNSPNTLADAAKHDQIAKVDQKNRPEGTYRTPQGTTTLQTASGEVGDQKKIAAERAFWAHAEKVAAAWGPHLPVAMPLDVKRDAIVKLATLAPEARRGYVENLHVLLAG